MIELKTKKILTKRSRKIIRNKKGTKLKLLLLLLLLLLLRKQKNHKLDLKDKIESNKKFEKRTKKKNKKLKEGSNRNILYKL
jgi:hypothetical protein